MIIGARCGLAALFMATFFLAAQPAWGESKTIYAMFLTVCDGICQGFRDGIAESGLDAEIVIRDFDAGHTPLSDFVREIEATKPDLVLTDGTNASLGIAGRFDDIGKPGFIQDIPHVFTDVADPFGAGLAHNFDGTGRANLAGTFNRPAESVNVEVIRAYDPSFDTLGLLYHSNERNSVIKKEELVALSEELGFRLVAIDLSENGAPPQIERLEPAMRRLADEGVRWVYVGSSSFISSDAAAEFTSLAVKNGIGVVSPYEKLVREHEALVSIAADFYEVGRLAASQAVRILSDGATPGDLPVIRATEFAYVVNMEVARRLQRFPPIEFMQIAEPVK